MTEREKLLRGGSREGAGRPALGEDMVRRNVSIPKGDEDYLRKLSRKGLPDGSLSEGIIEAVRRLREIQGDLT